MAVQPFLSLASMFHGCPDDPTPTPTPACMLDGADVACLPAARAKWMMQAAALTVPEIAA